MAVSEPQADGSVPLPYHRTQARLADASALSLERTVPWEQALPGELLSVFSTYYDPAPTSEIQQGRIFNIAEGVRRRCGWIAPISVYPGELEQEALAYATLKVLRGQAAAMTYSGRNVWQGFEGVEF